MSKVNAFKGTTAQLALFGTPQGSDIIVYFNTTTNRLEVKDSAGTRYYLVADPVTGVITFVAA